MRTLTLPLPGGHLVMHRFPGRWMKDDQLAELRDTLGSITAERFGEVPAYGPFLPGRAGLRNRIVTLFHERGRGTASAFSAMVHSPVRHEGRALDVVNLGLTVSRATPGRHSVLPLLIVPPLAVHGLLRAALPFWVVTFTARPRTVGFFIDHFDRPTPHPTGNAGANRARCRLARAIFEQCRADSGVAPAATLEAEAQVVRGSNAETSEALLKPFSKMPMHHRDAVNRFCATALDYDRGDEFLLIARAGLPTLLRFVERSLRA